ncbi:MAG: TraR/DksA C4-type zinc finger protein [Firmicutes bacterium]|nr:TraR/DksA C4-type zinc finger protein [Bacillota bacterium]
MRVLSAKDRHNLEEALLLEKQRTEALLVHSGSFGLHETMGEAIGELSAYDNHPADMGTEVFERGKDFALREDTQRHLAAVDEALQRLSSGEYGQCTRCYRPISSARLYAQPWATLCIDCARQVQNRPADGRPVEEEVLGIPWRRERRDGEVEYDQEDAWQDVERYGTSSFSGLLDYQDLREETIGAVEELDGYFITDLSGDARDYRAEADRRQFE